MKHIESIQPEYAADDMTALLLSDATASAALSRLLHDWTGCAIPPTADTPQSEVEELVPLCLSILRRHWTTPLTALGDGTTPMSLADLLRRLILGRVDGNEALGIPPANADIPTAVAALRQRDMSSGLTLTLTDGTIMPLPDGLSLAQLLCSGLADNITELHDSNKGWTATKPFEARTYFPNCEKIELGCKEINCNVFNYNGGTMLSSDNEYNLPILKKITPNASGVGFLQTVFGGTQTKPVNLPELEEIGAGNRFGLFGSRGSTAGAPFPINIPKLKKSQSPLFNSYAAGCSCGVNKIVVGTIESAFELIGYYRDYYALPNLVHLEFGQGTKASLNLAGWSPTTALSERLPEFLSNFKTYIAQRLTDKGSGLTLTLSQAVRDAIQQDPEIVNIITSKGWTISPAPSV